ncbi:DUF3140 domain-containing protein [Streptomyces chryseus]|uniref:DUF3140 domain-containing protein n=1 Tax=Streptomyces chryseus TaxID=68186 RepID=A0ABQ3DPN9_9ACTN|nr:DUF3140 domain-containing protein [Streptomyces chryseus]GHB09269.1 hypothetical protein GCM10010346_35720 [Streptomyces chryseus]
MDRTTALELDWLWDDFHRVVNMTSQELGTWLRTSGAGENSEPLPERAGTETGRKVLAILGKRRTDLEPAAGDSAWRRRLMTLGHAPLKPA